MNIAIPSFTDHHLDAESIFGSTRFPSEAARQEHIDNLAKSYEQSIAQNVLRDKTDAEEVGANLVGFLDDYDGAKIARLIAFGDREGLYKLFLTQYIASIKRTAEHRAIKEVERSEFE